MMQDSPPTRATLLALTKKIRMVTRGHSLLKRKLDSLVLEISKTSQEARKLEENFEKELAEARELQIRAFMEEGAPQVAASAARQMGTQEVLEKTRKYMGLTLKQLLLAGKDGGTAPERKFFSSPGILLAAEAFQGLLQDLLDLASAYYKVHLLLSEVERTRRRVNALEYKVIPETEAVLRFIEGYLGEQERESLFRVKRAMKK